MIIYACDSTAGTAATAILDGEKLLCEYTGNNGNTHSETLLPMTETMLKTLNMTMDDVDVFACSVGPGSFTGVRIGAATVKGLAFGRNKPCVEVPTLEALALNVSAFSDIILPVMDARRNQFYTAFFESKDGKLNRLTPDRALSFDELKVEIDRYNSEGRKITPVGDGYRVLTSKLNENEYVPCPERLRNQSAYNVGLLALQLYNAGCTTSDKELKPRYLRLPQAERERNERLAREAEQNSKKEE